MYSISAEGIKRENQHTKPEGRRERGEEGEWKDRKVIAFHFISFHWILCMRRGRREKRNGEGKGGGMKTLKKGKGKGGGVAVVVVIINGRSFLHIGGKRV
jgi:hypothetical protein